MTTRTSMAAGWLVVLLCTLFVLNSGTTDTKASNGDLKAVLTMANAVMMQRSAPGATDGNIVDAMRANTHTPAPAGTAQTPVMVDTARTNVDRYIDVASAIDTELGEILRSMCGDEDQDPVELERMIRRYGRGLVALADLKESDPGFFDQKIMELNLDAEIGKQAQRIRQLEDNFGADNINLAMERAQLEAAVRTRLRLSIRNRQRSIERIEAHIESLRDRVVHDQNNFNGEIDRQLSQLLGELDAVQAALGR